MISRLRLAALFCLALPAWYLCAPPPLARAQLVDEAANAAAGQNSLEAPESSVVQHQGDAVRKNLEEAASGGPYGKGPNYVPGQPVPVPRRGQAAESGAEEAPGKEKGPGGLIFYDQLRDVDNNGPVDDQVRKDEVPEQYIVVKGDTLWSICTRFFQNPWYWPKLWSFNEMITNPHWIYPGDLLSMFPPGKRPPLPRKAESSAVPLRPGPELPRGLFLRQNGFVEQRDLEVSGRLVGSKEEKIMLASNDEVYVEVNKKQPLQVNQRYTVYRVLKPVRRPYGNKETLGNVVEILGDVEIKQVTTRGIARAVITEALGPMERGFRVGPLRRRYKLVDPKVNRYNLQGVIVEALVPSSLLNYEQLIFIDLGRDSGLQEGNRLFVVRRGDAFRSRLTQEPAEDKRYPKEAVAEITIVEVREKTAAGLITKTIRETQIGDRVEARKGF